MWQLDGPVELLECDEEATLYRCRQGLAYIDGVPTLDATAAREVKIIATFQPMGGRELLLVPEGFRGKESLWLWQAHRTLAQDIIRAQVGDVIFYMEKSYQVRQAEDWGSYTKCLLVAIDVGPLKNNTTAFPYPSASDVD